MVKIHGFEIDLSWLAIISTIASLLSNVTSIVWITEPIQKQMIGWVGKLQILPLFLYRMLSWVVILASLKSFASAILIIMATINFGILFGSTNQLLETAALSIIFPAFKFPSSELPEPVTMNLFFRLAFAGNVLLMASLLAIYILYLVDVMNPWCSFEHILVPEEMLNSLGFLMMALFFTSTIPAIVFQLVKKQR